MSFRTVVNVIGAGKGPDGRDFAEERMRRNGSIDVVAHQKNRNKSAIRARSGAYRTGNVS